VTCSWYTGTNILGANDGLQSGAGTAVGTDAAFTCESGTPYPTTAKLTCGTTQTWSAKSYGPADAITNWGCGVVTSCWERPRSSDGNVPTSLLPGNPWVFVPFEPVAVGAYWCPGTATQSPCCPTGQVLKSSSTGDLPTGIQCTNALLGDEHGSYARDAGILSCGTPAR
jgi:hypothetical protein